jgi:uncharacterized protein (TIGR02391 family)
MMNQKNTPELIFAQSELEAIAQALADTNSGLTGTEIGHLLATLKIDDVTPEMTKWKRLYNAFAKRQNLAHNRRAILQFIREAMKPERYAMKQDRFEPMRLNINRVLALCGLIVDAGGKLSPVEQATTLSEANHRADDLRADLTRRGVHTDVLVFCKAELVGENYFHAVLEATKSIAEKIRKRTGLTEDGAKLVDLALCGNSPRLSINAHSTESHRSEQSGFANLVKGTFGMFRNPTAHEAKILWAMTKEDAEDLLSLASLVHRRLDSATLI